MSTSWVESLFELDSPSARHQRDIDNHYHMEKAASNLSQLVNLQSTSFAIQANANREANSQLAGINHEIDGINSAFSELGIEMGNISQELNHLHSTAQRNEEILWQITDLLDTHLTTIARQMMTQQMQLEQISEILRQPLESQVQELRRHANEAMINGMTSIGKRRQEWYRDAIILLKTAVDNPIGKQDYVAWFQIGWLLWKADNTLSEAEDCFARASRLASSKKDDYYILALRHLAYLQYLQGHYTDAINTMQEAMMTSRDPFLLEIIHCFLSAFNQK